MTRSFISSESPSLVSTMRQLRSIDTAKNDLVAFALAFNSRWHSKVSPNPPDEPARVKNIFCVETTTPHDVSNTKRTLISV